MHHNSCIDLTNPPTLPDPPIIMIPASPAGQAGTAPPWPCSLPAPRPLLLLLPPLAALGGGSRASDSHSGAAMPSSRVKCVTRMAPESLLSMKAVMKSLTRLPATKHCRTYHSTSAASGMLAELLHPAQDGKGRNASRGVACRPPGPVRHAAASPRFESDSRGTSPFSWLGPKLPASQLPIPIPTFEHQHLQPISSHTQVTHLPMKGALVTRTNSTTVSAAKAMAREMPSNWGSRAVAGRKRATARTWYPFRTTAAGGSRG